MYNVNVLFSMRLAKNFCVSLRAGGMKTLWLTAGVSWCCLLLAVLLALSGCSTAAKKNEPKELAKLSQDSQEEAQKLRDAGNLQASAAKYQEALRYHPSPSIHYELGEVLAKQGKNAEAKAQYDLALAKNPGMPEAQEALDRLNARQDLADKSSAGPGKTGGRSSSTGAETVAAKNQPLGAKSKSTDVYDEDRKFAEMEKIQPPPASASKSNRAGEGVSIAEPSGDVDALMSDTEAIYGSGRGSEPSPKQGRGSAFEDEEPASLSAGMKTKEIGGHEKGRPKPLKGGRGLLQGGSGIPSVVISSPAPEPKISQADFRSESETSSAIDEQGQKRQTFQTAKLTGKPGERGLGSTQRLPSDAPPPPDGPRERKPKAVSNPRFNAEPEPIESQKPRSRTRTSETTQDNPEEKGMFQKLIGSDEITYPEPTTPAAEQALPSPYVREKEELDVRPFHTGRLKGRPKPELDLEVCKDRYYKEKDLEGAVRCLTDKKIDFPDNPVLYSELALIYEDAGDYSMARKNMELAVRYGPENQEYKKALARLDVGKARERRVAGEYIQAAKLLLATIEKYPEMVEAYRELGKTYSASALAREKAIANGGTSGEETQQIILKEWTSAEGAYQDLLSRAEGDYKDWYNLGVAIQKQGVDEKRGAAIKAYEKAVGLQPDYGDAHYNLGALYESSNVSKATEHYETALSIGRRMPKAEGQPLINKCLASLGELNWRIGNKQKAAQYLTEYIQYAPNDSYVEQMLNQITTEPL